jgi:hypothetical protein
VKFTNDTIETITAWKWDFGDTYTSILMNPTHYYSVAGKYNVNRYITDVLNEMASEKKEQDSRSWFAYRSAAKAIYDLDYEITPWNLDELKKIKGIGKVMFDIIKNILPEAMRVTASTLD